MLVLRLAGHTTFISVITGNVRYSIMDHGFIANITAVWFWWW